MVIPLLDTCNVFIGNLIPLNALLEAREVDVGLGLLVEVLVGHLDLQEDLVLGAGFMFLSRIFDEAYFPHCTNMAYAKA